MAISTILTEARQAVWDAILNWADLDGVWKRKYRHDETDQDGNPTGDDSPEIDPHADQLPAIRILFEDSPIQAELNRMSELQFQVRILIYTSLWYLPTPEGYLMEIIKCLFQESTGTGTDYVKTVTGFHPITKATLLPPAFLRRNDQKMTRCGLKIPLRVRFDPLGS